MTGKQLIKTMLLQLIWIEMQFDEFQEIQRWCSGPENSYNNFHESISNIISNTDQCTLIPKDLRLVFTNRPPF